MRNPLRTRAARRRIEIGVEDAACPGPLQLDAGAFADLEAGLAETAKQLAGGQADEGAGLARLRGNRAYWRRRGLGGSRAGGDEQSGEGGKAAHGATIAILAAFASRG